MRSLPAANGGGVAERARGYGKRSSEDEVFLYLINVTVFRQGRMIVISDQTLMLQAFKPARAKFYTDKNGNRRLAELMVFDRNVFNPEGIECERVVRKPPPPPPPKWQTAPSGMWRLEDLPDYVTEWYADELAKDACIPDERPAEMRVSRETEISKERSQRRAKRRIEDLVCADYDLDLFVTLTVSPDKHDRKDYQAIVRHVGQWLDNRVRRTGLKYVLVPEGHKDGSVHFHGFFNRTAARLEKTKYKRDHRGNFVSAVEPTRKGKRIYNLADYDIGYTTALKIGRSFDDRLKSVRYVLKYIEKGAEKIGGRWYLHGGKLREPEYEYMDALFDDVPADPIEVAKGVRVKIIRYPQTPFEVPN